MRAAVASVVLAAAIATPGVVVAAMSSGGNGSAGQSLTASGSSQRLPPQPLAPALRPAVQAVRVALDARGAQLHVVPAFRGAAELIQLPGPGRRCPILIVFQLERQSKHTLFRFSCGTGTVQVGGTTITYTPSSVGPTVRAAVAGLPR